ncbi:MAG TPA: PIN domain nuclease [Gaiellaceae bacterium]|nr:PIN domain nuclease [Gaiellaceae bacterium]
MTELADTSAWIVAGRDPEMHDRFRAAVASGEIATCGPVSFELLYGTRNAVEFSSARTALDQLRQCPIGPRQWQRALDVYEQLARTGGMHHRAVKHFDLLTAAAAESAGVTVLHYDADFDEIAAITGQPTRWIAPRGSL